MSENLSEGHNGLESLDQKNELSSQQINDSIIRAKSDYFGDDESYPSDLSLRNRGAVERQLKLEKEEDEIADRPILRSRTFVESKLINDFLSSENTEKQIENIGIHAMVDELQKLNPNARIMGEWNTSEPYIVSSIDIASLNFPDGYYFNTKNELTNKHNTASGSYESIHINVSKTSTVDSFVGSNYEDNRKHWSHKLDQHQSNEVEMFGSEIEKTTEQNNQIDHIIELINNERLSRGQTKRFIDHKIIHFFKSDAWREMYQNEGGHYNQLDQSINVLFPDSKIRMLEVVAHELLHADSFNSVKIDNRRNATAYRVGFELQKSDKPYFRVINEAITQERTRALMMHELENNRYYADEVQETNQVMQSYPDLVYVETAGNDLCGKKIFCEEGAFGATMNSNGEILLSGDAYRLERQSFRKLVNALAVITTKKDSEIFDMFVKATVNGNYIPIARTIEKSFGRGKFRELGESSVDLESFEKFVDSLSSPKASKFGRSVINRLKIIVGKKN